MADHSQQPEAPSFSESFAVVEENESEAFSPGESFSMPEPPLSEDPVLSWNPETQPENAYSEEMPTPSVAENFEGQQETAEAPYDFSQTLDTVAEPPTHSSDLSEIADFANGETSMGGMSYELLVSGLDSVTLLKEFREIISDARFVWNEEEILSQIKRGELVIKDLPPIKAAILVNRLKYLELKISWRQSVYT